MSMSIFSGQIISRTGRYKICPIIGISLMIVGLVLLSRVGVDTPFWVVAVFMAIFGVGLGGDMQPLTLAVQKSMPPPDMGVATAAAAVFPQMGGTLGAAGFLSLPFSTLQEENAGAFPPGGRTPPLPAPG